VTEAGPVEIEVPRDRESTFEPVIVGNRQRRLSGIDDLVISLSAKGLTHGEISAHLAEIYGAQVPKQTISAITDRVMEGMAAWQNRPLDRVYPVIFIDCVNVKIREGNVANRPLYVALAVTVEGHRDILGLWAGEHGDGQRARPWVPHRQATTGGTGPVPHRCGNGAESHPERTTRPAAPRAGTGGRHLEFANRGGGPAPGGKGAGPQRGPRTARQKSPQPRYSSLPSQGWLAGATIMTT
jgi:hypothetical protein